MILGAIPGKTGDSQGAERQVKGTLAQFPAGIVDVLLRPTRSNGFDSPFSEPQLAINFGNGRFQGLRGRQKEA